MTVLTIATSELRRLAGIDAADTSQDTVLAAVATAEQPAYEFALDPTTLADTTSGVRALLTLGVSEQLAGSYLQQTARAPLPFGTLTLGAIKVTPPTPAELRSLGLDLAKAGTDRLAPYTRSGILSAAARLTVEQQDALKATAAATLAAAEATDAATLIAARLTVQQQDALSATARATLAAAEAADASALTAARLTIAQQDALAATARATIAEAEATNTTDSSALAAAKLTLAQQDALIATAKATLAEAEAVNATAAATAKLTVEQQAALTATAKATQAAQAADTAAALDAAKLTIAQGQAAKYLPVDPSTTSILQGPTSASLFGTLNPLALDTDDSEPPLEFSTGYVPGDDDDEVDDPDSPYNVNFGSEA